MGDIKSLRGHPIATRNGEVNEDVVACLEDLLEKAKSGHIRAIAWCSYTAADMVSYGWQTDAYGFHVAAAIMTLNHEFGRHIAEGDDAP